MSGDIPNRTGRQIRRRNLDTFKLLISDPEFQDFLEKFRMVRQRLENGAITHSDYAHTLIDSDTEILEKYNLPANFRLALSIYLQTEKISEIDIPARNYEFKFRPRPTIKKDGRPIERVWEVHLVTYTRLTEAELKDAFRQLKKWQNQLFPQTKLFTRTKPIKSIDRDLEIEKRGSKRKRKTTTEEYTGDYLSMMKQQMEAGRLSKKEFDKLKKLHSSSVKKVRRRSYAARHIAKDLKLDIKPPAIRQIIKRLKKERRSRFVA